LARFRALVAVLISVSVVASTAIALTWPTGVNARGRYDGTVWTRLAGLIRHGTADPIASWGQKNVLAWIGVRPLGAAAVVMCSALAATVLAFRRADASSPHLSGVETPPA
jgi:hypothetical protein